MAFDGEVLAVGAHGLQTSRPGAVYVFERDAGGPGNWGQRLKITASDRRESENDRFGQNIALDGKRLAAAAIWDDSLGINSGQGYLFDLVGAPTLSVMDSGNKITVSWEETPYLAHRYVLEQKAEVLSSEWTFAESGTANPAVLPSEGVSEAFRLRSVDPLLIIQQPNDQGVFVAFRSFRVRSADLSMATQR
jgi:hypothetical protein